MVETSGSVVEGLAKLNIASGKFTYFKPEEKEVAVGIKPVVTDKTDRQ